jgi:hypothetical protein
LLDIFTRVAACFAMPCDRPPHGAVARPPRSLIYFEIGIGTFLWGVQYCQSVLTPNDSGRDASGLPDRSYGGRFFLSVSRAPCRRNTWAERYCGSRRLTLPRSPILGQFFCVGTAEPVTVPIFLGVQKTDLPGPTLRKQRRSSIQTEFC